jgi:hypothetical protein
VRKVAIIVAIVLLQKSSPNFQVIAALALIITSLSLQLTFKPYFSTILNRMESLSLSVHLVTLLVSMFYTSESKTSSLNSTEGITWFFLSCLVTVNAAYYLYWLYCVRVELLKLLYIKTGGRPSSTKDALFWMFALQERKAFFVRYKH